MVEDELRLARYRLKQAHKTIGRQGQTIHRLRGELAEVRQLNSKIDRGDIRSLESAVTSLVAELEQVRDENAKLRKERSDAKKEDQA